MVRGDQPRQKFRQPYDEKDVWLSSANALEHLDTGTLLREYTQETYQLDVSKIHLILIYTHQTSIKDIFLRSGDIRRVKQVAMRRLFDKAPADKELGFAYVLRIDEWGESELENCRIFAQLIALLPRPAKEEKVRRKMQAETSGSAYVGPRLGTPGMRLKR
jgi:hypothetical protein